MENHSRRGSFDAFALGCLCAFVFPFASILPFGAGAILLAGLVLEGKKRLMPCIAGFRGFDFFSRRMRRYSRFFFYGGMVCWGLFLGLAVQGIAKAAGGVPGDMHMPGGTLYLEGQAARDMQVHWRQGRRYFSLDLEGTRFCDAQGRELLPQGKAGIRIYISCDEGPEEGLSLENRLVFAGEKVSLQIEDAFKRPESSVQAGKPPADTLRRYVNGHIRSLEPGSALDALRGGMLRALIASCMDLGPGAGGLALALLLGRQDFLLPQDQALFLKTGCVHLIALSGMHISLVLGLAFGLFRRCTGPRIGMGLGLLCVIFLIWLVGPFPSAVRALLMCLWVQVLKLAGFRMEQRQALGMSTLSLLIVDPLMIFSLGYQLSCCTLYGLLWLQEGLVVRLKPTLRPVISEAIGPGIAAQSSALPLLALRGLPWYPQGILAGLILEPLCLLMMALATIHGASNLLGLSGIFLFQGIAQALTWVLRSLFALIQGIGGFFVWFP